MRTDYTFEVCRFERFSTDEDPARIVESLAARCKQFRVRLIAADGAGNGYVYNRLLADRFDGRLPFYAMIYSNSDHQPQQDGMLYRWTVNRSGTIGNLFARVRKKSILFPAASDCATYLDELAGEVAEYDDVNRCIRFTHPESQPDDALHALVYALQLGIYSHPENVANRQYAAMGGVY